MVSPPNILYSAVLMIAGVICLFAMAITLTRRKVPGSSALIALLSALAWWDITYAFFWIGVPGPSSYFWLDITYLGVVTVPPALFIFSLQLAHLTDWLKRPLAILIYLVPLMVLAALFTDGYHGLFFAGKRTENSAFILDAGPMFWVNIAFSYTLVLLSTILMVRTYLRSKGLYRRQIGIILFGMAVTWLNSIIFVLGISPLPGADNTPFSFTIAAAAFTYSLLRYHFLDVVPVARDVLIEKMSDGVLVVDDQHRIVDINPAAQNLLQLKEDMLGQTVEQAFWGWPSRDRETLISSKGNTNIEIPGKSVTYLNAQTTPIFDHKERLIGRLIVFHDITRMKSIQNELHLLANRDSLTGVVNRRHFMELAKRELSRAKRYRRSLALILMDLDNFKKVNDTYGHQAGDQALLTLKKVCTKGTRTVDIFARLGGEEFVLMLPEIDQDLAASIAERLREALEKTVIRSGSHRFKVTVSMGVTECGLQKDDTLDAMLSRADKALYRAKESGRNRVLIWQAERK
ncbi:MAG TPA: histidine kinase N-terminal 7TM domain-containing protein [Anaerolineales bacterium]|nr:histidine kinase N-terminal 7TM domain-containing protein [Anaerolineales bacterium]